MRIGWSLKMSPSHKIKQKIRTNTQEISWDHLPCTQDTSLAPFPSNDTHAAFFLRQAKETVAFLHTHWQRLLGSSRQERDSLRGLKVQGQSRHGLDPGCEQILGGCRKGVMLKVHLTLSDHPPAELGFFSYFLRGASTLLTSISVCPS